MTERDNALDEKRLDKAKKEISLAQKQLDSLKLKLKKEPNQEKLLLKITEQVKKLRDATQDERDILDRIKERQVGPMDKNSRKKEETQREYLVRTGKITPFSNLSESSSKQYDTDATANTVFPGSMSHQNLHAPVHTATLKRKVSMMDEDTEDSGDEFTLDSANDSDDEYTIDEDVIKKRTPKKLDEIYDDDGSEMNYQKRLIEWIQNRKVMRHGDIMDDTIEEQFTPHPNFADIQLDDGMKVPGELWDCLFDYQKTCVQWLWELHRQHVGGILGDEMGLGKTIQVIAFLSSLYYSKILGPGQASIIVCPATVMKQWVQEFHKWWPPLRVAILHASGTGVKTSITDNTIPVLDSDQEYAYNADDDTYEQDRRGKSAKKGKGRSSVKSILTTKAGRNAEALVEEYVKKGGILITTYSGVQSYREILLKHRWGYVVLDEGHKIRNPDSGTTLAIKQFKVNYISYFHKKMTFNIVSKDTTSTYSIWYTYPKQFKRTLVSI